MEPLSDKAQTVGFERKAKKDVKQGSDLNKIIKVIMEKALDPVIVFSFSKRDVEANAKLVTTKYDLATKKEK